MCFSCFFPRNHSVYTSGTQRVTQRVEKGRERTMKTGLSRKYPRYVIQRGYFFHYRQRVPVDLQFFLKCAILSMSLQKVTQKEGKAQVSLNCCIIKSRRLQASNQFFASNGFLILLSLFQCGYSFRLLCTLTHQLHSICC